MIYGTGYPVISSALLAASIALDGTYTVLRETPDSDDRYIENESVLTGRKHRHLIGEHLMFPLTVIGVTRALMLNLALIKGTEITYYPHNDNTGRAIPCYLKKVIPFYYNNITSQDAVKLEIETVDPWKDNSGTLLDTTGATPIDTDADAYWVDEAGDHIIDENGNKLILSGGNE